MKVAHFLSNFPLAKDTPVYGKSLAAYNVCKELSKRGHEVTVFTNTDPKSNSLHQLDGITVCNFSSVVGYKSERFSTKILFEPLKQDFDIIHIHSGISVPTYAGYRYARKKQKPLIITWHGDSVRNPDIDRYMGIIPAFASFAYGYLAKKMLDRSNRIISVSQSYIAESKFLGSYKKKIRYIPNGVQLEDFNISYTKEECKLKLDLNGKFIILFMGSLFPIKGPDILIKAIPAVIEKCDKILFIFAGGGNVARYQELADQMNLKKFVKFLGYVGDEKKYYLAASDIFVLPSFAECFPLVNLEAMASGIPVIASNVGGVSDAIIDNVNGILIPPGDSEKLADAILKLINNSELRINLGQNGKKMAADYSWAHICKLTEDLYSETIGEGDSRY